MESRDLYVGVRRLQLSEQSHDASRQKAIFSPFEVHGEGVALFQERIIF